MTLHLDSDLMSFTLGQTYKLTVLEDDKTAEKIGTYVGRAHHPSGWIDHFVLWDGTPLHVPFEKIIASQVTA
jgi:hypothetical protein